MNLALTEFLARYLGECGGEFQPFHIVFVSSSNKSIAADPIRVVSIRKSWDNSTKSSTYKIAYRYEFDLPGCEDLTVSLPHDISTELRTWTPRSRCEIRGIYKGGTRRRTLCKTTAFPILLVKT